MNLSQAQLAARLESALGAGAVLREASILAAHCVDGKQPTLVCAPQDAEQIAALLRLCAEARAALVPWGGGTAMAIGNTPKALDIVVTLHRLNDILEHDHANLTATVQSGITMTVLQQSLARENQFLPIDPPHPTSATIGVIVAANINGPRRLGYGSVRDLVIGMKLVLASGEQIKAGGKVVKNVAGYDMCKLFVGSLGTLGIISEVTVRMAPLPESAATLVAAGPLSSALQFASELAHSPLLPAGLSILNPSAAQAVGIEAASSSAAVWFEGFDESLARQLGDGAALAHRHGLKTDLLRGPFHLRLWTEIGDFPLSRDRLIYRIIVPRGLLAQVMNTLAEQAGDFQSRMIGEAGSGSLWLSLAATDEAARWFGKLVTMAADQRGHAVMFAAPARIKAGVDVWGQAPPGFAIMREIKQQFDPQARLSPGRFVGGL